MFRVQAEPIMPERGLWLAELARALRARPGDTLTFLASDRDGVLNAVEARLVGLLAHKTPGDRRVAQLALPDADALLRMEGRVTEIAVAVSGLPPESWMSSASFVPLTPPFALISSTAIS